MCTFEVCLKIPDMNDASQQTNIQFSFNNFLCKCTMTRHNSHFSKLTINITGNADSDALEQFFLQIYKILFFNYGYFPEIISAFKSQLSCYTSAENNHARFFRVFPPIVQDISRILNESCFEKFISIYSSSNIKMEPILQGFFYLCSRNYENVLIEHKIILLLHIFEGYGQFLRSSDNVDYATRHILKECYTNACPGTKHEIFIDRATKDVIKNAINPLLQKMLLSKDINKSLLKIRNYYSHFYENSAYKDGDKLFLLFLLISLSIRIRTVSDIIAPERFLSPENANIKECFLIIADYAHKEILKAPNYQSQSCYYNKIENIEMLRRILPQ